MTYLFLLLSLCVHPKSSPLGSLRQGTVYWSTIGSSSSPHFHLKFTAFTLSSLHITTAHFFTFAFTLHWGEQGGGVSGRGRFKGGGDGGLGKELCSGSCEASHTVTQFSFHGSYVAATKQQQTPTTTNKKKALSPPRLLSPNPLPLSPPFAPDKQCLPGQ